MADGQSCQEQHLLICFLCYCAENQDDLKKNSSIKNVQVTNLNTSEVSKVSLWPLLQMNHYKSLITCSHTVLH